MDKIDICSSGRHVERRVEESAKLLAVGSEWLAHQMREMLGPFHPQQDKHLQYPLYGRYIITDMRKLGNFYCS